MQERFIDFLCEKQILVNDYKKLKEILDKISFKDILLLFKLIKELLKRQYDFYLEIYENENNINDLYFIIKFSENYSKEDIDKEINNLYEFLYQIDKNCNLWFIKFIEE